MDKIEKIDKSLEEAARRYQEGVTVDTTIYYCGTIEDVYFANRIADAFIARWKCRDDQMPMPEDTVLFNKGVMEGRRLEREDMLKGAIEGTVHANKTARWVEAEVSREEGFICGDKVKVIVLKEEE